MKTAIRLYPTLLCLLLLLPSSAGALRCGQDLVTIGDSKLEVLKKCGDPFWRESRGAELREEAESGLELRRFVDIDEWTYNFGPHQFLYYVIFENGRVTGIDTGDYGFDPDRPDGLDTCREGKLLEVGDSAAEVIHKCGEPDTRERWVDEVVSRVGPEKRRDLVPVEEWAYNFGPHHFVQLLRFRNGRLVEINHGGYGY